MWNNGTIKNIATPLTAVIGFKEDVMKKMLQGKRVVVTGASRGVGLEIASMFLAHGAGIIGVARNRTNIDRARKLLAEYGGAITWVAADVAQSNAGGIVASAVRRRWGVLDVLINNAAVNPGGESFVDERVDVLERTFQINVFGMHRMSRALLPFLFKGRNPRIINLSSGAGNYHSVDTGINMPAYRLSKHTVNGLTKLYANRLKGKVSVVAMDPGWVRTEMGGPDATDSPILSAERALEIVLLPQSVTGKYLVGSQAGGW